MPLFSIPRTRPDTPAELRGPCRKRSRRFAFADAQTLKRRGRFQTSSPAGQEPKTGHGALAGHKLRATGHHPVTITTYQALRTTYHVPTGRTHRSAPTTRYSNALRTTSHMPRATGCELSVSSRPWTTAFAGATVKLVAPEPCKQRGRTVKLVGHRAAVVAVGHQAGGVEVEDEGVAVFVNHQAAQV